MAPPEAVPSLCDACASMNFEALMQPAGCERLATKETLRQSQCPMCKLIGDALSHKATSETEDILMPATETSPATETLPTTIRCRLKKGAGFRTALCVTTGLNSKETYISVFASESIARQALKDGLVVKLDLGEHALSAKTQVIIGAWIEQCLTQHKCDKPLSESMTGLFKPGGQAFNPLNAMPARLIQLDAHGAQTWDCQLVDFQEGMTYAALTYCWGTAQADAYKTTTYNIAAMRTRILFAELPGTLQHAVVIARNLGLRYLWVDAVCIIQDSVPDWDHESALMGGIYSNAYVTISADLCDSADVGIIDPHRSTDQEVVDGAVRIPSVLEDGTAGALYFHQLSGVMSGLVSSPEAIRTSPLSQRGWTFQERILSKRILHYTKKCIYWECREGYICEDNVFLLDHESSSRTLSSTVRIFEDGLPGSFRELTAGAGYIPDASRGQDSDNSGIDKSEPRPPDLPPKRKTDTLDIVHFALGPRGMSKIHGASNSSRDFKGERRHFISWWNKNIVAQYSTRTLTRQTDRLPALSALARLFGEHIQAPYIAGLWLDEIEDGLDWRRAGSTFQATKLDDYPTFSWIAQPGPVHWPYIAHMRPHGEAFSVLNYTVDLATPDAFGRINSATLSLSGCLGGVRCLFAPEPDPLAEFVDGVLTDAEGTAIGDVEMDMPEYPAELDAFLLYRNSLGFLRVLMLTCADRMGGPYRRVGVGQIHPRFAERWLERSRLCAVELV